MSGLGIRLFLVGLTAFSLGSPAISKEHFSSNQSTTQEDSALHKKKHEHKHAVPEVKHSVVINAKPEYVWQAIQHQRKNDNHRKLLSYDGTNASIHETFASLPIVGEASCVYVENESTLYERIDYSMVKSESFNVFQGAWILSPGKNANETVVELSNAIDPGIRVPFWQDITKMAASRLVKRRLEAVTAHAEHLQKEEKTALR